jgi:energy-coupling factor transporter ATP-binding protein EcfA2
MSTETTQNSHIYDSGLLLHASAVNIGGKALIFLGHSSSGKSTISRILAKKYSVISDDKVWASRNSNGEWYVGNGDNRTVLKGTQQNTLNSSGIFPILSFIRIYKSKKNEINKINSSLSCKHLIDAVFEVDNQRKITDIDLRKNWFYLAVDLSKKYQGWHFSFNKNAIITGIIEKTFEK